MASKLLARLAWLALVCSVGQHGYSATLPTMPESMTVEHTTELPPLENAKLTPLETTTAETLYLQDTPETTDTPVADPDPCPIGCDCPEREEGLVVICSHRGLTTIPETVPNSSVYVNLKLNSIQTVTGTSFSKWPTRSIRKLNLSHNNISVIDETAFRYFGHLWTINLGHNSLTTAALSHLRLPALHELNLEDNPLELDSTTGSGFKSYHQSVSAPPDTLCGVVHRRTSAEHVVVDSWRFLENVTLVLSTVRCARPAVEWVISATPDFPTAGPNLSSPMKIRQQVPSNAVSPDPSAVASASCPTNPDTVDGKLSKRPPSAKPNVYELMFYVTLAVVFASLMLFLVSQKYKHAWLRCGKPPARRSTRRRAAGVVPPLHPPLPFTHVTLTPLPRAQQPRAQQPRAP